MSKLLRSLKEKEKIGFWLLNPASKFESFLLSLFFLLLPTQLGKHFWPNFSIVSGIRIDYLSPTLYLTDLILLLLFGFFVLRWFKTLKKSKVKSQKSKIQFNNKKKRVLPGGILFFALFTFTITLSSRPALSIYGFAKLCEYILFSFYLAQTIRHQLQLQHTALLFSISALFESLLAIFQYLHQGSLNGGFYFFGERAFTGATPGIANASINGTLILRPYATFSHPNVLAGYLLVAMILVWSFLLRAPCQWMKIIACISLLVSSVAILLTYSRVAILLWAFVVFLLLLRMGLRKVKTPRVKRTFFAIAAMVLLIISFLPLTHEIYARFMQTSLSEESVVERTELLSASWKMIREHPLTGVGLYNFIPALAPLQKPLPLNLYLQPVHNIFVLVAVETGVIGLGLFIRLLVATMNRIKNHELRIRGTLFVLLSIILITGLFDHYWLTLQQGQLLFATVLGLSWIKITNNK